MEVIKNITTKEVQVFSYELNGVKISFELTTDEQKCNCITLLELAVKDIKESIKEK